MRAKLYAETCSSNKRLTMHTPEVDLGVLELNNLIKMCGKGNFQVVL